MSIDKPEIARMEMSPEMECVVLRASNDGEILVSSFGIDITRSDVETLKYDVWLNDQIINFYLEMIVERSWKNVSLPKVYSFSTFFYPKLLKSGHSEVERWTRKVDLFSHDLAFVPVHLGKHWCLAVVDFRKSSIFYYDSMRADNDECLNVIEKFLKDEHLSKKKVPLDSSRFAKVNVKDIPVQTNHSDCEMFALKFAEYLSRNADITFTEDDMHFFRRRMIFEIVEKKLLH